MALIHRVKLNWTGFVGAPGYSVFHFNAFEANGQAEAQSVWSAVNTFALNIANNLPNSVMVTTDPEVERLEDTTNTLDAVYSVPAVAGVNGTGGLAYSAPVGAVVNWRTERIRNGRRMRGRTFLVPLTAAAYENDGSLIASVRTDIQDAAAALIADAATQLVVYGRPTILGNDGVSGDVTSSGVPDMAAVLRSRRD